MYCIVLPGSSIVRLDCYSWYTWYYITLQFVGSIDVVLGCNKLLFIGLLFLDYHDAALYYCSRKLDRCTALMLFGYQLLHCFLYSWLLGCFIILLFPVRRVIVLDRFLIATIMYWNIAS